MTTPEPGFVPEAGEEPAERRRPTVRGALVVGARTTTALIGAGVAVAAVLAAATLQIPTWSASPSSMVVVPEAAAGRLVCAGALLRLADDSGADASSASPIATPTTTLAGVLDAVPIAQSDAGTGGTDDAPVVLEFPAGLAGAPSLAAGAQEARVAVGDLQGLATTTCAPPAGRQWLIAGATTVGRTTLLTITNPTTVAAVVDLTVLDEGGPVTAAGLTGVDVPAGAQRVIPLAGFVLDAASLAVLVTSTGGNVVAALQSSTIRTLQPGGLDLTTASASASTTQIIPGIAVADGRALRALQDGGAGYADTVTSVRLVAPPGGGDVAAEIVLVPDGMTVDEARAAAAANPVVEGGEGAANAAVDLSVPAARVIRAEVADGRVVDVPIPNVGTGRYTAVVTATTPFLAAVRVSSSGAAGVDFAWVPSATPLAEQAVVAVPGPATSPASSLVIANPSTVDAVVTVTDEQGAEVEVTVPAGTSVSTPVPAGATLRLDGGLGLVAAIVTGGDGLLAVSPVQPPAAASRPVTVYP